jgi:membrane-bound lytic murein transglycosylase A
MTRSARNRGWQCIAAAGRILPSLIAAVAIMGSVGANAQGEAREAQPIAVKQLPGWGQDRLDGLRAALLRQCALRPPPAPWPGLCKEIPADADLRAWVERRFVAWPLADERGRREGLITGYHEPLLTGSLERENASQMPLFAPPAAVRSVAHSEANPRSRVQRWHTRAEIESGQLEGLEPIAFIDDPVEAFFLHVQGSARIKLRDGSWLRVGYAGHNGHTYRAIGRVLVERGALSREEATAPGIKAWLRANPGAAVEVMHSNPRYVFFRKLGIGHADGPLGALGVPLTAGRSIATDRTRIPIGALMFLDGIDPLTRKPLRRAVVSQDTGGAIIGTVRADVFWGAGDEAERRAGLMREMGRLWLLWPADAGPPAVASPPKPAPQ